MKTAIVISGQMRTFARTIATLKWHVFRKLENPVFYVSCADDANAASAELLRKDYPEVHIEKVTPPALEEPPLSLADSAPYAITPTRTPGIGPLQGILRQHWHMSRAWKFVMETGLSDEVQTVVRCRADLHFHKFEMIHPVMSTDAHTPWWGNYGGVNDRFAVLGVKAAKAYHETFDVLPQLLELGCPFHPESLVAAALEHANCNIERDLCSEFAFRRENGEFEHMVILPSEMARYTAAICAHPSFYTTTTGVAK